MAEKKKPQVTKLTEYIVNTARLNVRAGAGYGAEIAKENGVNTVLADGTELTVIKTKSVNGELWGQLPNKNWVCLSYCNLK